MSLSGRHIKIIHAMKQTSNETALLNPLSHACALFQFGPRAWWWVQDFNHDARGGFRVVETESSHAPASVVPGS
jgi:hypothetical protein